jgi:hypothetical protein
MLDTHVVAILSLSGSVDAAVVSLAEGLGTTAYELRLTLAAGFPAVVLVTADDARAADTARAIQAKGHRVAVCDRTEVTPSARMTELRDFRLSPSALAATATGTETLPFTDICALLRATHRSTTVTTQEVKERKLRPAMAIATGGMILSKTTTKEVTSRAEDRQQVLYLFRKSGASPWILRERNARYAGLGPDLRPTSLENFATSIRKLRELCPRAVYDERLVNTRAIRGLSDGIEAIDLIAHLLSIDLSVSA